jgi:hypothetical protein
MTTMPPMGRVLIQHPGRVVRVRWSLLPSANASTVGRPFCRLNAQVAEADRVAHCGLLFQSHPSTTSPVCRFLAKPGP